jgi:hypothetical protein
VRLTAARSSRLAGYTMDEVASVGQICGCVEGGRAGSEHRAVALYVLRSRRGFVCKCSSPVHAVEDMHKLDERDCEASRMSRLL